MLPEKHPKSLAAVFLTILDCSGTVTHDVTDNPIIKRRPIIFFMDFPPLPVFYLVSPEILKPNILLFDLIAKISPFILFPGEINVAVYVITLPFEFLPNSDV